MTAPELTPAERVVVIAFGVHDEDILNDLEGDLDD